MIAYERAAAFFDHQTVKRDFSASLQGFTCATCKQTVRVDNLPTVLLRMESAPQSGKCTKWKVHLSEL